MKRRSAGEIGPEDVGTRVLLQAWVHRRRDHGGVLFMDLRDRGGLVQAVVRPEDHPEAASALDEARLESVVEVEGTVVRRSPETVNPRMPTGEIEVVVERGEVVARSDPLPFSPAGNGGAAEASEEVRLRYRFLDLRRQELQENLRLRAQVNLEILQYFHERGFVHLETPMLTRSTPEGARDYLVPSRVRRGSFYALPQSPQLFKQLLMVSGFERYVQIARCFRDEDLRSDRQPEFTQVDVEMSFPHEEDIYELIESLFERVFPLVGVEPELPFPRLTYADAMTHYGSDRPDLRVELEIVDLSSRLGKSEFRAFREAVERGDVVRGLAVPGAAAASRKQIDGWADLARLNGAAGALVLKRVGGEVTFQVKGVLRPEELEGTAEDLGLAEGGLALLVAGGAATVSAALGALRLELGRSYGHFRQDRSCFLWVTEFPLVEWSPEEERWLACNHPFTSPRPEDLDRLDTDPGSVQARAYDVVLNGVELGGGSIRIHDRSLQQKIFDLLGMSRQEAEERFGFLLEALRYGAPPHGGIALGLDRLIMLMAGASSLRDVIAFPKTASAVCLMTEAPAAVDLKQIQELGLRLPRATK